MAALQKSTPRASSVARVRGGFPAAAVLLVVAAAAATLDARGAMAQPANAPPPPAAAAPGNGPAPLVEPSVIDLHGPDGLVFSADDPLRVAAATQNGVFFLSYNSLSAFPTTGHANIPGAPAVPPSPAEKSELGFIDLTNMTVTRRPLFPASAENRWQAPIPIGGTPPGWRAGVDYLVGGSALRHEIHGGQLAQAREKEREAAVLLDPAWVKIPQGELNGCPGGAMAALMDRFTALGVDYTLLERFSMDKGQVVACLEMPANFKAFSGKFRQAFSTSFRVRIGEIWSKLKPTLGGFLVGLGAAIGGAILPGVRMEVTDGYIRMPTDDIRTIDDLRRQFPDFERGVADQISDNRALAGRVTSAQILTAALASDGDCASVGITDGTLCEEQVRPLIQSARTAIRSLVAGPKLLQGILDCVARFVDGRPPVYGWRPWRDPNAGQLASLADRVVKVKLEDRLRNLLVAEQPAPQDDGRPNLSGGYTFQSAFLYGPKGKWLIQRQRGVPPLGLIEQFVYARLNSINPYDLQGPPGRETVGWRQLDLITQEERGPRPPRLPWPPRSRVNGGLDSSAWAEGTCQMVGDEAANGTEDNPDFPEQVSTMCMVLSPDERRNALNIAFSVRSTLTSGQRQGRELIWARYPPLPSQPSVELPPSYAAAGRGARLFRVGIANVRDGRAPRGYRFDWDIEGDNAIDSQYGNVVRKIDPTGAVATCYVVDPVTGRTGAGMRRVE
jgi:hypothetical protein